MRTALIPTSYNPFQLYYVIQNFKNKWYNTVDKLYISFDSEHLNELFQENFEYSSHFENIKKLCYDLCDDIKITIIDKENEHFFTKKVPEYNFSIDSRGKEIRQLISNLNTDLFFITHDDIFYSDDSFINSMFELLKENDVVGLTAQASDNISFKINSSQLNESYLGFSSHNFFSKLNVVKNTDGIFNSMAITNKLPYVNVDCGQMHLEYFIPFSLQLYSLKNKLFFYDNEGFDNNNNGIDNLGDRYPKFIHFNLGSSFLYYLLNQDAFHRTLDNHLNSHFSYIDMFVRRLSMYNYFFNNFPQELIEKYKLNVLFKICKNNLNSNVEYLNIKHNYNKCDTSDESYKKYI